MLYYGKISLDSKRNEEYIIIFFFFGPNTRFSSIWFALITNTNMGRLARLNGM